MIGVHIIECGRNTITQVVRNQQLTHMLSSKHSILQCNHSDIIIIHICATMTCHKSTQYTILLQQLPCSSSSLLARLQVATFRRRYFMKSAPPPPLPPSPPSPPLPPPSPPLPPPQTLIRSYATGQGVLYI